MSIYFEWKESIRSLMTYKEEKLICFLSKDMDELLFYEENVSLRKGEKKQVSFEMSFKEKEL